MWCPAGSKDCGLFRGDDGGGAACADTESCRPAVTLLLEQKTCRRGSVRHLCASQHRGQWTSVDSGGLEGRATRGASVERRAKDSNSRRTEPAETVFETVNRSVTSWAPWPGWIPARRSAVPGSARTRWILSLTAYLPLDPLCPLIWLGVLSGSGQVPVGCSRRLGAWSFAPRACSGLRRMTCVMGLVWLVGWFCGWGRRRAA